MKHRWFSLCCFASALLVCTSVVLARGPKVSENGNVHNLSALNTGVTYHAKDDTINNPAGQQICIFCHTPHSSSAQGPLWNRKDTDKSLTFALYTSNTMTMKNLPASQYSKTGEDKGQPNGSSRLCLSCHDGVTPLGGVINSGQNGAIQMIGGDTIDKTSITSFHPDTNKMKSGHHPVSFVYATGFSFNTQNGTMIGLDAAKFKLPITAVPSMEKYVKLQDSKRDRRGWMQCTTCHDAHQNMGNNVDKWPGFTRKMTPFWVYSGATTTLGHDNVCNSCHTEAKTTPDLWK